MSTCKKVAVSGALWDKNKGTQTESEKETSEHNPEGQMPQNNETHKAIEEGI